MPEAHRKEAIDAAFGVHVRGTIDFLGDAPPSIQLDLRTLDSVHLANIETAPFRLVTPPADDDAVYLGITMSGGGVMDAHGGERTVRAGDFTVMRRDRRCTTFVAEPSKILSIAIPRAQLVPRLAREDHLRTPGAPVGPAARLLQQYAAALMKEGSRLPAQDEALIGSHVIDLALLALGGKRDEAVRATKGGVRAARRAAIKADIAANRDMPELTLDWIARRQQVSAAYVRALFYEDGTSFTDYVLRERLEHVHALLCSPYLAHHRIASLALMAGFSDISWFNQAFRRRFGLTPSDVRSERPGMAQSTE